MNLDAETRAALGAETANFAVVLGRLHAEGESERLARLVVVLLDYWYFSGALGDADRWHALAEAGDVPARTRAQLHLSAGSLAFVSGDLSRARASFDAAHARAVDVGDDLLLARIVMSQGAGRREVGLLGLGLTGEIRLDLIMDVHRVPDANNDLSRAGSDRGSRSVARIRSLCRLRRAGRGPRAPR